MSALFPFDCSEVMCKEWLKDRTWSSIYYTIKMKCLLQWAVIDINASDQGYSC